MANKLCKDCKWIKKYNKLKYSRCSHNSSLENDKHTELDLISGEELHKEAKYHYCSVVRLFSHSLTNKRCGKEGKYFESKEDELDKMSFSKKPMVIEPEEVKSKSVNDTMNGLMKAFSDPNPKSISGLKKHKDEKTVSPNVNAPSLFEDWEQ